MKEHVYRENLIIEYSPTEFMATILEDDESVTETFKSLSKAKKWIDEHLTEE